jgi:hypothetical protein
MKSLFCLGVLQEVVEILFTTSLVSRRRMLDAGVRTGWAKRLHSSDTSSS